MGRHSKYAESYTSEDSGKIYDEREFPLRINPPRRYDPSGGAAADEGPGLSLLTESCTGDWAWQPGRSSVATPTYHPRRHPRACVCCGLTACLSLISHAGVCG